jgi:site-specific recombinase XerD
MALTLPVLIDLFVETKRVEGRSPKTCSWYRNMISRFARFVGEDTTLDQLSLNDARAFVAHLQGQDTRYADHPYREETEGGISSASIAAYVRAVKAFSAWMAEEGYTEGDLLAKLKRPRIPSKVVRVLSEEEIRALLMQLNPNTFLGARLYTIIALMLDTGLRAGEMCRLKLVDVAVEYRRLKVMGKGQKERFVFFGVSTQKVLLRWKLVWRPTVVRDECDTFFVNVDGSSLTYSALTQAVKRAGKNADIPRLHCHLLRHTFAVRFLTNGGNLMALRDVLGHSDIAVTQIYLSMTPAHLQVQYEQYSPMDRIMTGR